MARSTKAEIERRRALIYPLVVAGAATAAIAAQLAKQADLPLSKRTLARDIAACRERMLKESRAAHSALYAESLARKRLLFQRALAKGDLRTALAAQQAIDRMFGDFAATRGNDYSDLDRFLAAMESGEFRGRGE